VCCVQSGCGVHQDGRIFSSAADYEFVICVWAKGGFGFSEFILWSALKPAPNEASYPSLYSPTTERNTMKINTLFAAIALTAVAASLPVLAQEATYDYPQAAASQVSRQAVLADLAQARADGTLLVHEGSVGAVPTLKAQRYMAQATRMTVRVDAQQTAARAQTAALIAEPHDFTVNVQQASTVAVAGK
jgi:Domain of unknown function (DUF4148)